ncbi:23206_t:CDS:1, partial [Gigaspora rosea]
MTFQKTLNSLDKKIKNKSEDEPDIKKAIDNSKNEDFYLNKNIDCSNIDMLVERAKKTLENT